MSSDRFAHLTEDQIQRLAAMPARWNEEVDANLAAVREIYEPLVRCSEGAASLTRELPYGDHPRQVLDVFTPHANGKAPVIVYVHGGAFVHGQKSKDGVFYDNVLHWFARQGFVGINVEYRLAPEAKFPDGGRDIGDAVQWIAENIEDYGGDPDRIVLFGHSAGGTHVETYLLSEEAGRPVPEGVRAAIVVSARLRADLRPDNPMRQNVEDYFGPDPAFCAAHSPVSLADRCRWPTMIAFAGCENRHLDVYSLEFAHALASRTGRVPRVLQLPEHNHFSIVAHFNSGEEELGRAMLDFLKTEADIEPGRGD